jgi:hypothetical protein
MKIDSNQHTENSIRTYSGKSFDLSIRDPDSITIEDIAHGLSHQPRFAGQLKKFYTVAQHSVLVASLVPDEHKLAALMHDSAEAYMGDMPSPFKKMMPDFKYLEYELLAVISEKYGFEYPFTAHIKKADTTLLKMEWESFVFGDGDMYCWPPDVAKATFIRTFEEITKNITN